MDVIYLFTYGQTGPGLWSRLPSRLSDTEWQTHRDKFITVWTNSSTNGEPWDNTDKRPSDKTFTMEGGILCTIGIAQRFPIMEQCSQRKKRSGSSKSSFKVPTPLRRESDCLTSNSQCPKHKAECCLQHFTRNTSVRGMTFLLCLCPLSLRQAQTAPQLTS